jgi:hypothetical protein
MEQKSDGVLKEWHQGKMILPGFFFDTPLLD